MLVNRGHLLFAFIADIPEPVPEVIDPLMQICPDFTVIPHLSWNHVIVLQQQQQQILLPVQLLPLLLQQLQHLVWRNWGKEGSGKTPQKLKHLYKLITTSFDASASKIAQDVNVARCPSPG